MKTKVDLVKGWLRKAESDLLNARICMEAGQALDTECFHAQQAAEKYIKAYLTEYEIDSPFIHNLEKLVELCTQQDKSFTGIKNLCLDLTPYAVELRYDDEFWPSIETTREAFNSAQAIRAFILERLSADYLQR
jgi:HEPN domain-containing protein